MILTISLLAWLAAVSAQPVTIQSESPPIGTVVQLSVEEECIPVDEGKDAAGCGRARQFGLQTQNSPGDPRDGGDGFPREAENDTDVQNYLLDIEVIPEYSGPNPVAVRVVGQTQIDVQSAVNGLTQFTVDLYTGMTLNAVNGNVLSHVRSGDQIIITLDQVYNIGDTFQVFIDFSGYPSTAGFGAFQWWTRNSAVVIGTLSEPYYARTWWACKDRLNDKATFDIHCTAPDPMVVASNGLLQGTDALSGSRTRYRWHVGYPMATYLASLAVTNYQIYNISYPYDDGGGPQIMPVTCYLYPDHWDFGAGQPTAANKAGCDELPTMLEKFGIAYGLYPFLEEKYGVAETGGTGGLTSNMEHQTMTSMYQVSNYSDIMAHELAHHWWGDNVTCSTWNDIWLNEGFASYSESMYRELKPGGGVSSYWARMEARRPSNPDAQVYRTSINNVNTIFSSNDVYNKGSWVLHMLRHVMGDTLFFQALADYRASYQGGFATTDDFAASISATFGHDLTWFTDQWVMNPGSPKYEWNYSSFTQDGQAYLKLFIRQTQNLPNGYGLITMPIDVRVTVSGTPTVYRVWNNDWLEYYVIPISGTPTLVEIDEDGGTNSRNWILFRSSSSVIDAIVNPPVILTAPITPFGPGPGQSQAVVTFSDNVTTFDAADFTLTGDSTGAHAASSVVYVAGSKRATLTFDSLPNDDYTLTILDATIVANGKLLDGEVEAGQWYDTTLLPSGDGQPGGDAVFHFSLLAGDANCDGTVTFADVDPFVEVALGNDTDLCHFLRSDADNSGEVNGIDVQQVVDAILEP